MPHFKLEIPGTDSEHFLTWLGRALFAIPIVTIFRNENEEVELTQLEIKDPKTKYENQPFWVNARIIPVSPKHMIGEAESRAVIGAEEEVLGIIFGEVLELNPNKVQFWGECKPYISKCMKTIISRVKEDFPNTREMRPVGVKQEDSLTWESDEIFSANAILPVKKSGGRPRDPANQWAYEQVNVNHKDVMAIYLEWKTLKGKELGLLADPLDSFKKAIKPRKKGT